ARKTRSPEPQNGKCNRRDKKTVRIVRLLRPSLRQIDKHGPIRPRECQRKRRDGGKEPVLGGCLNCRSRRLNRARSDTRVFENTVTPCMPNGCRSMSAFS